MSSPLDRIEANALRSRALLARLPQRGPNHIWRDDVLALVNVAKAAEEAARLSRPTEAQMHALREALAVLDKEPA